MDHGLAEQLHMLHWVLAWPGGIVPVYRDRRPQPVWWCESAAEFEVCSVAAYKHKHEATAGLPDQAKWNGGPTHSGFIWAWIEGSNQLARAKRFRPLPSVAIKVGPGSRRLLMWLTKKPVPVLHNQHGNVLHKANKRLAYALRATQKLADPDRFRAPLPGTALLIERKRPAMVEFTRCALEEYAIRDIVGRLKDPPPPNESWKESQ